jgi:hypothetical protein
MKERLGNGSGIKERNYSPFLYKKANYLNNP